MVGQNWRHSRTAPYFQVDWSFEPDGSDEEPEEGFATPIHDAGQENSMADEMDDPKPSANDPDALIDLLDCTHCGRPYSNQTQLRNHLRDHHGEEPRDIRRVRQDLKCPHCPVTVANQGILARHVMSH